MDIQPPLVNDDRWKELAALEFAAAILPSEEFTTSVNLFPGALAFPPWGTSGDFFISFTLFDGGKKLGEIHSQKCDVTGRLAVELDDFLKFCPAVKNGLIVARYRHAPSIPIELYFSHLHKPTGTYFAYPAAAFIGDKLYPEVHAQQLENTMFWPGLVTDKSLTASISILNPFKVSFAYQFTLYKPDGQRVQTQPLRIKPYRSEEHRLEDLFPEVRAISSEDQGKYAICVAAQYKVVAYHLIRHNESNAITGLDHLHTYCLV